MQMDTTRAATYVGAGAATGIAFTALRHGTNAKALALGVATGVVAGGVETYVHERTGTSELGWAAAIGTGAVAGAALLGGFSRPGMSSLKARGIGAVIGAATGLLAPVAAGVVLAQLRPSKV